MKQTFVLLTLFAAVGLTAQPSSVDVKHAGYRLSSALGLPAAGPVVMIGGTLDTLTKKKTTVHFGYVIRDNAKNYSKVTVAELFDAVTNRSIRKIMLDEWLGTTSATWKEIKRENNNRLYTFSAGGRSWTIHRSVNSVINQNVITGRMISESIKIESDQAGRVRLKLYGRVEGTVSGTGSIVSMTSNDPNVVFAPSIVLSYNNAASVEIAKNVKKGEATNFTVTSADVALTAGQPSDIVSYSAFGTSVSYNNHSQKQAINIRQYLATKQTVPELAAVTASDKQTLMPGDTVTYSIIYHNIGSAAAADVTISNPIPANTAYVENSAAGEGSTITVDREKVTLPKIGVVTSVSWNFKEAIYPGEERTATFKVIIQ